MSVWYRFEDRPSDGWDSYSETITHRSQRVKCYTFRVIRETPKGVWLDVAGHRPDGKRERWVSRSSHRRFAWPTRAEALTSFIARKQNQLGILAMQMRRARLALKIAQATGEGQSYLAGWEYGGLGGFSDDSGMMAGALNR